MPIYLIKNPVRCSFNHIVDALGNAGGVEDDSFGGWYAIFVVVAVDSDGACDTETIYPASG